MLQQALRLDSISIGNWPGVGGKAEGKQGESRGKAGQREMILMEAHPFGVYTHAFPLGSFPSSCSPLQAGEGAVRARYLEFRRMSRDTTFEDLREIRGRVPLIQFNNPMHPQLAGLQSRYRHSRHQRLCTSRSPHHYHSGPGFREK
jgi:hypothetical protein